MSYHVSDEVLDYDRSFVAEMMQIPVTNRDRLRVVCRALRDAMETELTPRQREILLLSYFERKSGKEIAETLGIVPSTVTRTRQRAEQRLRRSLRFYMEYLNSPLGEE